MKRIIALILGIALLIGGLCLNMFYENEGIAVDATITRIKTVDDTDDGPISYKHTYYGSYTVDGQQYEDKKLATRYNSSHIPDDSVGDTVRITVSPNNPGRKLLEGGGLGVIGMIITVCSIISLAKQKKQKTATE